MGTNNAVLGIADQPRRAPLTRGLTLLIGFVTLLLGMVVPSVAHAADGHTVSGVIDFPDSAPESLKEPVDQTGSGDEYTGLAINLYVDQPGPVEGWEYGTDDNVSYDSDMGAWSVTGVPDGAYRLSIYAMLPGGRNAMGTMEDVTVAGGDVSVGTTAIPETAQASVAFGFCGLETNDDAAVYAKNVATGQTVEVEPGQFGEVAPSEECPPELAYGGYVLPALEAGDYEFFTVWNGDTQYYTGFNEPMSSEAADALVVELQYWESASVRAAVLPHIVSATPTITGTAEVGQTLTAEAGQWQPDGVSLAYQWLRDGAAIGGATSATYTVASADVGATLAVRITGSKTGLESMTATSAATEAVPSEEEPEPELPTFPDVPEGHQFFDEISWLVAEEITTGKTDAATGIVTFDPKGQVTREATAAFLYRLAGVHDWTAPDESPFSDLPTDHQFYEEITWLADAGITTGKSNGDGTARFDPKGNVSREAVAAFVYRFEELSTGEEIGFTGPAQSEFTDMRRGDRFYDEVEWMRAEGLTTGKSNGDGTHRYDPTGTMTREAMAAFLYRYVNDR